MPKNKLPEKLSDVLDITANDFALATNDPGVTIDMGTWLGSIKHKGEKAVCIVCVAGSVMRATMKLTPGGLYTDCDFLKIKTGISPCFDERISKDDANRLFAIDKVRGGRITAAIQHITPLADFVHPLHLALLNNVMLDFKHNIVRANSYNSANPNYYRSVAKLLRKHGL